MPKESIEWQKTKKKSPWNVKIRMLLRERGPLSPNEIMKELGVRENTLYAALKNMLDWGELKKLDDGRYADYQHKETDKDGKMIQDMMFALSTFIPEDKLNEDGVEWFREHFEEGLEYVATGLVLDTKDQHIRQLFSEAARRLFLEE
jgi:hypothetical protein